jgi:hypothetical protein
MKSQTAPSAGEITPPWAPIVCLPALNYALIVVGWHVEMHEVYSSVCSFRDEGEDQGRIWIRVVKSGRAPGLDHEPLRDDLERRTGERAIEGLERRTRLEGARSFSASIQSPAWRAGRGC